MCGQYSLGGGECYCHRVRRAVHLQVTGLMEEEDSSFGCKTECASVVPRKVHALLMNN